MTNDAERAALRRALDVAATPGVPLGPNPRVGCVLLAPDGAPLAEGHHRGAGTAHAEVAALEAARAAGVEVRGATAVVTLEPCDHTGRTGPCTQALLAAGVARVVVALPDPNPEAAGGAETLRAAGVDVEVLPDDDDLARAARDVNRAWLFGLAHARPLVTWKFAATLDGRSAAADGTSRWVSSRAARLDTHRLRGRCDTMLVGTGTVAIDDPLLTVRDADDQPLPHQPLRVVMGERALDPDRRILQGSDGVAPGVHLTSRDPAAALADLHARGQRHVFLEGGPTLAAAFLNAGLVDEVVCYLAPMLLGAGRSAIGDLGITTISEALHLAVTEVTTLGDDADRNVRLTLTPNPHPHPHPNQDPQEAA